MKKVLAAALALTMLATPVFSVPVKAAEKMSKEELQGKIITGIFNDEQYPEYTDEYEKIIERAGGR